MKKQAKRQNLTKEKVTLKFRWQHDRSFRLLTIGLLLFSSLTLLFLIQTLQR